MIVDMSKKVLEHLAMKYSNVKKGVSDIMGGKILEYPTKTAWRQGMQEGMQQSVLELLQDIGNVSEELQNRISSELDLEVLKKWLKIAAKSESIEQFIEKCDMKGLISMFDYYRQLLREADEGTEQKEQLTNQRQQLEEQEQQLTEKEQQLAEERKRNAELEAKIAELMNR